MIDWIKLFDGNISLDVQTKMLPTKGNLVYEYNPFRNYRVTQNMYEYKEQLYSLGDLWSIFGISINCTAHRYKKNNVYNYKIGNLSNYSYTWNPDGETVETVSSPSDFGKWIEEAYSEGRNADRINLEQALIDSDINNAWYNVPTTETDPYLRESGELVDFITDELKFSLEHPVHIIPQHSYDGSVNLIINDGINIPRLINSRFSATGKNTYEIVDRKGNNDTNIYDQGDQFDIDTSLYKRVVKIPKIEFRGVHSGGSLKVGNYHFYFKLSDADGNETDFVGESSLVSIFIGFDDYYAAQTGQKNENSFKQVSFQLTNIDPSYDYVYVYYSRSTAEAGENFQTQYAKIDKKFLVNNAEICNVIVTGYEDIIELSATDINLSYNTVDSVVTSATCQNMLFLANVHKPDIPYNELSDLSLRFLPYLKQETYTVDIDQDYNVSTSNKGYLDPLFIYNKTGYWGKEIYRFGIVYILPNGELSPVFNIRGGYNIKEFGSAGTTQEIALAAENPQYIDNQYTNIPVYINNGITQERNYVNYNEESYTLLGYDGADSYENIKGVVSFYPSKDTNTIYSVDIRVDDATIQELKKYVKGYFFVRQTRIPTILAQGITIGIDKEAKTPTIPTADGFLSELSESLSMTHVTTSDINDVNFISEGFLNRYSFEFKKKSSSLFGKILKAVAIGVGVVALAAATVFTAGAAAAAVAGATMAGAVTAGASAVGTIAGTIAGTVGLGAGLGTVGTLAVGAGAAGAAAGLSVATAGGIQELRYGIASIFAKKTLNGRATQAPSGYKIAETESSRKLTQDFRNRFIPKDSDSNYVAGILCPDYEVDQAKYNQIFTGNEHLVELTNSQNINCLNGHSYNYFTNNDRHFYVPAYYDRNVNTSYSVKIIPVPDNTKCVGVDDMLFRSRAGEAEEAWRYECIAEDYKSEYSKKNDTEDSETISNKRINTDIIRGSFGPYLAFNDKDNKFQPAETVNIYIPGYSTANMQSYFYLRMIDSSTFNAITDRYDIEESDKYLINPPSNIVGQEDRSCGYQFNAYRGDCYLCQFTHRVNRNFNDPSAPYNDEIVDENTWKENYDPNNTEKYEQINLGDVNAIQLGMWVTFKVRSSNNLNIRTLDASNVDETAMCGHPRGYYPYLPMSTEGTYKHPESQVYNKGFTKSLSERWNFELPDVPYIKNWFGTRIMYSDIHVNDAYKNGFRVFQGTHYRDYTREYGEIVKLISLESNLLCVFEHGIALIPVNERAVAGEGTGGNVYINTSNVLPENPKIISDMFGSQWPESVLKVPGKTGDSAQYVYGVDTVAKKIWRTDGNTLTCISDFRVQEFLNRNITLGERELTPKIGIRNVKTVYNAFKRDVLFTFYDNTYGFEEKVWNLCWNELLQKFITFYSWVPSYMENINNIPFSFDRNTSKWIAKLGTSHTESSFADGITLSNVIIENSENEQGEVVTNFKVPVSYVNKKGEWVTQNYTVANDGTSRKKYIGILSLSNRILPDAQLHYQISYSLQRDQYGNYKKFDIVPLNCGEANGGIYLPADAMFAGAFMPLYCLKFKEGEDEYSPVYYKDGQEMTEVSDGAGDTFYTYQALYTAKSLLSELYYRNSAGHSYADYDVHKVGPSQYATEYAPVKWFKNVDTMNEIISQFPPETLVGDSRGYDESGNPTGDLFPCTTVGEIASLLWYQNGEPMVHGIPLNWHWTIESSQDISQNKIYLDLPIFKDITGKRPTLPREEMINPDKIVTLLNIKATISIVDSDNQSKLSDSYYNMKAGFQSGTSLVDAGYYESVVGIAPRWNLQFLSTDFWKHGQAGLIDIADDIYPTYWYGRQHPFEFECVVVNDPSIHKIFTNLEIVANKAKPESFHYEIIGETYDFAKDKVNMYFRQEAMKALWQYNGADISYDRNFLKVQPRQQPKSADFPHKYYTRQDTINEIEDYYIHVTYPDSHDYRHLSGAEVVYYPNRQEYRIWNHAMAVDIDDLSQDDSRSIISANCQYLEDRWKVTINPILVCYKNEYQRKFSGSLIQPQNSTWAKAKNSSQSLPTLPIYNSPIPDQVLSAGGIDFPGNDPVHPEWGEDNALYNLYDLSGYNSEGNWKPLDLTNWLDDVSIYRYNFGEAQNRKELDVKDKFLKIRIRYSGEELAVIDFLNTVYRISYA